ncbi:voltage-gated potassium channel [Kribbella antiqua]|uniref:Voltage-gated potassium channel n=1 Tax=Kribbella antiqua TaxID=2512217 RepID=A0A4R2IGR1_9ACTN|nr:voltage-gated potassium channel [Kribbella antiqua]
MVTRNADRLARYERRTGWLLTAAAVLFLVVYAWPILDPDLPPALVRASSIANITIWIGFGADYLVRLTLAPSKRRFLRTHILDLVVLVLPLLRPLRALRVVTALARMNRASLSFRGQTTMYVVGAVTLLGFVGALAVLDAERNSENANIASFGDALWWASTTITTVGYGDRFPTTTEGRIAGVALMIGGIALVGTITAALASWFVEHIGSVEKANAETQDEVASLVAELKAIRTELAAAKDTSQPEG